MIGIGVNPAGDAGDVSPPVFWLVGTSVIFVLTYFLVLVLVAVFEIFF